MYISQFHLLGPDNVRIEGCDTITGSEGDKVVGGMHGRAQHVLTGSKSVAVDVADKLSVLLFILPDAHGCTYPQVTLPVFDDTANLLAFQRFGMRKVHRLVVLSVQTDRVLTSVPMIISPFLLSQIPFACLSFRILFHPKSLKLSVRVLRQELH